MTTIYVTKYAFTVGVFSCDAKLLHDGKMARRTGQYNGTFFHGKEFHLTEDAARADFERQRNAKLASLRKQMTLLETASFKVSHK